MRGTKWPGFPDFRDLTAPGSGGPCGSWLRRAGAGLPLVRGRWISYSSPGSLQARARTRPAVPGRGLLWRQLWRRDRARGASSRNRALSHLPRSSPPHAPLRTALPFGPCSKLSHAHPKQESKQHLGVFYQLPIIIQRRKKRVRINSSHCPARFCNFVSKPRWLRGSAPPPPCL